MGNFGAYRAAVARAAGGVDITSLAGNDRVDPFDFLKYCSSAFFCANVTLVPTTIALWNGAFQTEAGGGSTGVFPCSCSPTWNVIDTAVGATGGGPLTIITPVDGALTGDFWNITYSGVNQSVLSIDYDIAAGTPKTGTLAFFVLVIHSRSVQNHLNKSVALEGGAEGAIIAGF